MSFVRLERGAFDHPLLKDGDRFRAWFWMVSRACWKPTRFDIHGRTVTLERGQFSCSIRELAEAWGWSKSAVERFLTRLKTETMIGTDTGTGRLVITIRNYAKYQDAPQQPGTGNGTPSGTGAGQERDIKEEGNKGTIEPDGSTPLTPRRENGWIELPDWLPAEPWNGWLEMREDRRKWPTARAVKLTIDKLTRWRVKGHDPGAILDEATENSWTTIYEPKAPRNDRQRSPAPTNGIAAALDRRIEPGGFAGQAGRYDLGGGRDDRALPAPPIAIVR